MARCVAMKADIVVADEREGDRRMLLNYGHTLAHALEATAFDPGAGWDLRHGEAVAIGLVFAGAAGPAARSHRRPEGGPPPAGGRSVRPAVRPAGRCSNPRRW